MRAYVQQGQKGDPNYLNLEQIAYRFWERGYEVMRFDAPTLFDGALDRGLLSFPDETIVAGGVGTVRSAIKRAQRPLPDLQDLPECLKKWIGRDFWISTLEQVRQPFENEEETRAVHVKPLHEHKKFKGTVFHKFSDLIPSAVVAGETEVLVQEVVEFVSEWRAYIFRGRIKFVANYRGDPLVFPDPSRMQAALDAFENRPVGCSMDWGITSTGDTLLVEVNDGYALGNYGLDGYVYTAIIEARWREIMGLEDNGIGINL
ncbi:MAG: hypothetical protein CME31_21345 [Gimesia sp.]|jgi:hypothetical protein|uniref:ATP-grasp domain-containing protein n=1 Tax=Gimesia maris TaxID=122 RepID=A0A3D3RG86_9PLAN|nr:hypothetical protein [Gimesia sp.]HCO27646.1 hypothetical protein [Gimesia maris]|tara:strand:+ start:4765 stop:5544 length:780 start_codon:yes stop_codon:yes gene_type:complete